VSLTGVKGVIRGGTGDSKERNKNSGGKLKTIRVAMSSLEAIRKVYLDEISIQRKCDGLNKTTAALSK